MRVSGTLPGPGRGTNAATARRSRCSTSAIGWPHPENLFELAEARWLAGDRETARRDFAEFEKAARLESDGWDNANRELVRYYAEYAGRPDVALDIARREVARRKDVFTLDAYTLALNARGDHRCAKAQIDAALAPGIRHPHMLLHAGAIAQTVGDKAGAVTYLRAVLTLAPAGPLGDEARRLLGRDAAMPAAAR